MLYIPKKEQWEKYSIFEKITLIGYWITLFTAIISVYQLVFDSSNKKHEIDSALIGFQKSLQQIKYINEKYHPENVYLGTREGILDAIDKLNTHHKEMHELVKFEEIYQLIKDYGKKKTNDRLSEVSILVKDKTMTLTLYVASIQPNQISGQKEFDKINNKYISLVNEVSSAYAEYHGFIQGLTLKDFEY